MITNQNILNLSNARPKTVSLIATPYTQAINHYLVHFTCTSLRFHENSLILQPNMILTIISQVGSINHQFQQYNTF